MDIDKTTLSDLAIFDKDSSFSVFHKLNFCKTSGGKARLHRNLQQPLASLSAITGVQQTLQLFLQEAMRWPSRTTNGTVMVIEKFYQSVIDVIPARPSAFSAGLYQLFHKQDFSLIRYSTGHCFDFIKDMQEFTVLFLHATTPAPLKHLLQEIAGLLDKPALLPVRQHATAEELNAAEQLALACFIRNHYKQSLFALLELYFQLDAWLCMAQAVKKYGLAFPEFVATEKAFLSARGLYHLLLDEPVAYDLSLDEQGNFLFLTGANMAGKSTFIKSAGIAVFLAHTGMGVPAQSMQLSLLDGLLSNINIADNISKGESYFYNEVQRIKATIQKINNGKKWLILIDELFKGTNIEDAMKCSAAVIRGLLKINSSLFILSTHLYEIAQELKPYPNIRFCYFETTVEAGGLHFSYQLKEGVSNDRLGYLVLQQEGVIELLLHL